VYIIYGSFSINYSESLWAARSGVRTPVELRDCLFSTSVQPGPGTHSASSKMGTEGSFQGVRRSERRVDHPPTPSADLQDWYSHNLPP
jgi:hypothetical protein